MSNVRRGRILAGEDARVRRRSEGRLGDRLLKQHATLRERVEGRSLDVLVAVAREVVRPQRVDGHDHHVQQSQLGAPLAVCFPARFARREDSGAQQAESRDQGCQTAEFHKRLPPAILTIVRERKESIQRSARLEGTAKRAEGAPAPYSRSTTDISR